MKIKSQKDFFSGLMFLVTGIAFAWGATNYSIGEGARMGPGYFPLMLGVLLGIPALGLIVGIYALTFIASMAGEEHKNKEVFVLATVLAVMSYLAFIVLLKLQFPVWPSFLTR
jgi:hypothetical protein